jgi:hypothetical protein
MTFCRDCGQQLAEQARFCTRCGRYVYGDTTAAPPPAAALPEDQRRAEEMHMPSLYVMFAVLVIAVIVPPWETAPGQSPEFLGFHFILNPPAPDALVSRILMTIELTTIAVAGFYCSWLFRKKR